MASRGSISAREADGRARMPGREAAELLTEREAAAMLRLQPTTLESWRIRKTGPALPYVKLGRIVRYRRADLERLISDSVEQGAGVFA